MCLVVFAPLVSQSLAAVRMGQMRELAQVQAIEHELCSTDDQDATSMPMHADHSSMPDDKMAACGYCDFLAGHAALPSVPPIEPVLVLLVLIAVACMPPLRHIALGTFPSGRPRDPPLLPRLAV
jgi:hypothetical protein